MVLCGSVGASAGAVGGGDGVGVSAGAGATTEKGYTPPCVKKQPWCQRATTEKGYNPHV